MKTPGQQDSMEYISFVEDSCALAHTELCVLPAGVARGHRATVQSLHALRFSFFPSSPFLTLIPPFSAAFIEENSDFPDLQAFRHLFFVRNSLPFLVGEPRLALQDNHLLFCGSHQQAVGLKMGEPQSNGPIVAKRDDFPRVFTEVRKVSIGKRVSNPAEGLAGHHLIAGNVGQLIMNRRIHEDVAAVLEQFGHSLLLGIQTALSHLVDVQENQPFCHLVSRIHSLLMQSYARISAKSSDVLNHNTFNSLGHSMISRQSLLKEQSLSSLAIYQLRVLLRDRHGLYRPFFLESINQNKCNSLIFILILALLFLNWLISLLFDLADLESIHLDSSIYAACHNELSPCCKGSHLSFVDFQGLHAFK